MFEALLEVTGEESIDNFQVAVIDGDIEIGIVPASVGEWKFVAVCAADNPPSCIIDESIDTIHEAIKLLAQYFIDEYPEEV